jgi:glutamine amidotransferase
MSVVIIDYESGNIASVLNMVRRQGGSARTSKLASDIRGASKLILPGVGAFDHGIKQLRSLQLFDAIQERVAAGTPVLGICLGMQLLGRESEEGELAGLGLVDAAFRRFAFEGMPGLRVPHVGWNEVRVEKENPLIPCGNEDQRFYFTHSYHAVCANRDDVLATAEYGYRFAAAYGHDNVYGVQFHPEKSHRFGMAVIKNFLSL